jgi:ABC-2 type transport system permease protein
MTASALRVPPLSVPGTVPPGVGRPLCGLALRQIRLGAFLVLVVVAGMSALVAATYRSVMADPAAVDGLNALAANPAVRTLFGEPLALGDPGGFTVWRTGTVVAVLLGTWSILATTRITRGEEDAGRWDLLMAGRGSLRSVVTWHVLVVGAVSVVVGAGVWAALVAAGTEPMGAAVHATGTAVLGLFFVGAGAFAAQVFPSRPAATGAAMALLVVTLLSRMIGDGVTVLAWLRWLSPFGLLELSRPYAGNVWSPLVLLAVGAVVLVAAAVVVAQHRDVGDGLVAPARDRSPRLWLLGSVEAFAVRRMLRPLTGWAAGVGAYFLLVGLVAVTMTEFLTDNPAFADAAGQAGFAGLSSIEGYVATLFAVLAMPIGGFAADRIGAFARAETDRRLTLLAAQPMTRTRLLSAEVVAATGGVGVLATVAGLAIWLGVTTTGGALSVSAALTGAWNTLPIALLSLGAAVLALGWLPRATGAAGALPAVGGFLLLVTAESAGAPSRVTAISPFAHLAPVPFTAANWPATIVMTAMAVALTAVGAIGYRRRDLRT